MLSDYLLFAKFVDRNYTIVYIIYSQAESQTEWITTYVISPSCGSRLNYTLNIIDTPGFADTRGIDHDDQIVRQIGHLFNSQSEDGVSCIDAICFLVRAPDARLTATQNYIFQSILSLFGKDIAENIFVLVTFADSPTPAVLSALGKSKELNGKPFFLFNNCALYTDNSDVTKDSSSLAFWNTTMRSFTDFFTSLRSVKTRSLKLSAEVLRQREKIEHTVYHLQLQVDHILSAICTLEKEIGIFRKHKNAIKDNQSFEYEVDEIEFVKVDISGKGIYTTNCLQCNFTCHESCAFANNEDKLKCVAMNRKTGLCRVCPSHCNWNMHANLPFIIRQVPKKVKKTYAEMKERYEIAANKKLSQEQVITEMYQEITDLEADIEEKMQIIAVCNNKLKEIALNPNPLSTAEYIDLLIQAEKREKKPGFQKRVDSLEKCKKRVEIHKTVEGVRERIKSARDLSTIPDLEEIDLATKIKRGVKSGVKSVCKVVSHAFRSKPVGGAQSISSKPVGGAHAFGSKPIGAALAFSPKPAGGAQSSKYVGGVGVKMKVKK